MKIREVIRPSSFTILPDTHTGGIRIEHFTHKVPFVQRQVIAKAVQLRLNSSDVRALSLADGGLLPSDQQYLSGQTVPLYMNGAFALRDAAAIVRKELRQFSGRAGIVATGGVDNLIAPEDTRYPRIMRATDGVEIAMANGLIPQTAVRSFGPAARTPSEGVPLAEVYDAVSFNPNRTRRKPVSKAKALSLDETGTVHMSDTPSLRRGMLTHHTWLDRETVETDPAEQPFVLTIAGGDGVNSLEDAITAELTARGIVNASWIIHAQGEDLVVKGAVIREMPDAQGVKDLSHLQQLQQPLVFTGGSMTVTGSMTPHHPDGALFTQTGLRYTRHEHGIGQSPDGTNRGGHINATILGEHSVAYIVIRPIANVIEVDASLTSGTLMEAMKLPNAASHTDILQTISYKIMGSEVIKSATNLGLDAAAVAALYTQTKGDMTHMLTIMESTSFRMNLLVDRQEQTRRILAEGKQAVRETILARLPNPEVLDIQQTPWEQIREDIMRVEMEAFGETGFSEEELREMIYDAPNGTTAIQKDGAGRIIAYTSAMPISWDYPERESEDTDTAYIESTAFATEYQGKGLVGKLMTALEDELRRKGFGHIERDARMEKGWADAIERHYEGRIMGEPEQHDSDWGPQKHYRISL